MEYLSCGSDTLAQLCSACTARVGSRQELVGDETYVTELNGKGSPDFR